MLGKIYIDFDNVLWDMDKIHHDFIKEHYGVTLHPENILYYNYVLDSFPKIKEAWETWEIYSQGGWYDGAVEFIHLLKEVAQEVVILTTTPEPIKKKKEKMIKDVLGVEVIHSSSKFIYIDGILIDDAVHHIKSHKECGGRGIIYDRDGRYGWNKSFDGNRATNYDEVVDILISLQEWNINQGM